MNTQRKINRQLLATFIEYAIEDKVTINEWNRFIVGHYQDSIMESARVKCEKLLLGHGEEPPRSKETRKELYQLAMSLRESP